MATTQQTDLIDIIDENEEVFATIVRDTENPEGKPAVAAATPPAAVRDRPDDRAGLRDRDAGGLRGAPGGNLQEARIRASGLAARVGLFEQDGRLRAYQDARGYERNGVQGRGRRVRSAC